MTLVFGDINPNYHGLHFPDTGLEKPDLPSLLDSVPEKVKGRVHHMEEVNARNMERVQLLDNVVREFYSITAGLVNNGMEVIRGYGKLVTALNICQQQILRKCGSFVRPPSTLKPTNPVSTAAGLAKKK